MSIDKIQEEIIAEFESFDDWRSRYKHIIELGRALPDFPEAHRTDDNIVKGCQNRVWLHASLEDGCVHFQADSEAQIVRGLVALLVRVYSGHPPAQVMTTDARFIDEVGLGENLTMNRANGLASMIKKMKLYAMAYNSILERS